MKRAIATGILALALVGGVGCETYEDKRPPVDQLDDRDSGLQSKEIVNATDKMAQEILADDQINARKEQLIVVAGNMVDHTSVGFNKDLFIRRLKASLGKYGKGRIILVENMARLKEMQNAELEGGVAAGGAGLQPDYILAGSITDLPKQGTIYFGCEFNLTGLKGPDARVQIWTGWYEVKVERE